MSARSGSGEGQAAAVEQVAFDDQVTFRASGGYRFFWTGMKVLKHDGSQHHLIGIRPTVPLERTLKTVLEGRDELVEKALELINRNAER